MTFRRYHRFSDSYSAEVGNSIRSGSGTSLASSKICTDLTNRLNVWTPVPHPSQTDFGPTSSQEFFRGLIEEARSASGENEFSTQNNWAQPQSASRSLRRGDFQRPSSSRKPRSAVPTGAHGDPLEYSKDIPSSNPTNPAPNSLSALELFQLAEQEKFNGKARHGNGDSTPNGSIMNKTSSSLLGEMLSQRSSASRTAPLDFSLAAAKSKLLANDEAFVDSARLRSQPLTSSGPDIGTGYPIEESASTLRSFPSNSMGSQNEVNKHHSTSRPIDIPRTGPEHHPTSNQGKENKQRMRTISFEEHASLGRRILRSRADSINPVKLGGAASSAIPDAIYDFSTPRARKSSVGMEIPIDFNGQSSFRQSTRQQAQESSTEQLSWPSPAVESISSSLNAANTSPLPAAANRSLSSISIGGSSSARNATFPSTKAPPTISGRNSGQEGSADYRAEEQSHSIELRNLRNRSTRRQDEKPVPGGNKKKSISSSAGSAASSAEIATSAPRTIPNPQRGEQAFRYHEVIPEQLPDEFVKVPIRRNSKKTQEGIYRDVSFVENFPSSRPQSLDGFPGPSRDIDMDDFMPARDHGASTPNESKQIPRIWNPIELPNSPREPPACPLGNECQGWPTDIASDIFVDICIFLSHEDVRNLRLVCKSFASVLAPIIFRNVVTRFGKSMFDTSHGFATWSGSENSIFKNYGREINKFGISFDVDMTGLCVARPKATHTRQNGWWGSYDWPIPVYPRFPKLQAIEDLVDNNVPLLKNAMALLTNTSELGLSLDSGHGWLNGIDMSDMAVFDMRCDEGPKVFGKTFLGENKWQDFCRNELFKIAQQNSINETTKSIGNNYSGNAAKAEWLSFLKGINIREYKSFEAAATQPDRDANAHTGGRRSGAAETLPRITGLQLANANQTLHPGSMPPPNMPAAGQAPAATGQPVTPRRGSRRARTSRRTTTNPTIATRTQPQWPIIFNLHSVSAEVGGSCNYIQNKVASPDQQSLKPGHLMEAQAQWLMETVWAQRAFLSAYTTAIILNRHCFEKVHSLHISPISSGLLPSLDQREFWAALPDLTTLKILVSPDWRTEHVPGDKSFNENMRISPVQASMKVYEFLNRNISKIERLSTLTVGFSGGGEHAPGMFARNQHVLPAPITADPNQWLTDHLEQQPDPRTMLALDHIKELCFENCWLTPCMLLGFMERSRDTGSLRRLALDSVSLTATHTQRADSPLTTAYSNINTQYGINGWLLERLPSSTCWPALLDQLTPGPTFFERKLEQGIIVHDEILDGPLPPREFRGALEKITLKSCGYVFINGVDKRVLNQNGLVMPNGSPMDHGLTMRKQRFGPEEHFRMRTTVQNANQGLPPAPVVVLNGQLPAGAAPIIAGAQLQGHATSITTMGNQVEAENVTNEGRIMMSERDPATGAKYFALGDITQAMHPVEKRVLEQAWGMKFGWGNDMKRWAAVEDGFFEGGTGRFSGVIQRAL